MIDAHCHVLDPLRFAYAKNAAYVPPTNLQASVETFIATLDQHHVSHALLVSPTAGYNYDNAYMLDTLDRFPDRFRGIARVPFGVDLETLQRMTEKGVIGARLDLIGDGIEALQHPSFPNWLKQLRACNWLLQIQCEGDQLAQALPLLADHQLTLLIDHCGRPDPVLGIDQSGFQTLLRLGREGHFAKLSGAFRFSRETFPHADCDPFVNALLEAFTPKRCVWGSDWPFLRLGDTINYERTLQQLERWLPDLDARREVTRRTPARLFGFSH